MSSTKKLVFPTYLHIGTLPNFSELRRDLIREFAVLESLDDQGRAWSKLNYLGGYSSYSSHCQLHQTSPNFAKIERLLKPSIRKMTKDLHWDLGARKLQMTTCWVNRMGEGSYHTLHLHPGSVLSGVLYVAIPRGSSPLKIEDPRMSRLMAAPPRSPQAPPEVQNFIPIPAKVGQFVLFESWLKHEVPPHRVKADRLSLSFNYEWL